MLGVWRTEKPAPLERLEEQRGPVKKGNHYAICTGRASVRFTRVHGVRVYSV